jgi:hypothetical protein
MIDLVDTQKEMVESLYTVEEAYKILSENGIKGSMVLNDDVAIKFSTPQEWTKEWNLLEQDDDTESTVTVGGKEYVLTKRALELLGLKFHVTRKYMSLVPAALLEPHMDYWLAARNEDIRFLLDGDRIVGLSKSPKIPLFSATEVFDLSLVAFCDANKMAEEDVYVDYKLTSDLDATAFRLINPAVATKITSHRDGLTNEDIWSTGLAVNHSQSGMFSTSFEAYMFAWWCTNGAIATHASSGRFDRRSHGDDVSEFSEWAENVVGDILLDLPDQFKDVKALTEVDLKGEMSDAAAAVFRRFRVPTGAQGDVLNELVETDDWSAYGLMNAITQAANPSETDEKTRNQLFRAAGDMAAAYTDRCVTCHRIGD